MKDLVNKAHEVMKNSYSPYSNFKVGAALKMKDGKIVTGTNVENASFGATICAERSAILSAVSQGYTVGDFDSIAVIADCKKPVPPCYMCRQVMVEFFDRDTKVIMANTDGDTYEQTLEQLTPYPFEKGDLK